MIKDTPGPGTYKAPSVFDKFKRLPAKQFQELKMRGGLTPNMGNSRNKGKRGDDLEVFDENHEI